MVEGVVGDLLYAFFVRRALLLLARARPVAQDLWLCVDLHLRRLERRVLSLFEILVHYVEVLRKGILNVEDFAIL
jgi:hypothetical protein